MSFGLSSIFCDNAPGSGILLGKINLSLDACQVVVIVVDTLGRGELLLPHIFGRISDTIAFGPLFMALDAGERAGQGEAAGTAILVGSDMASKQLRQLTPSFKIFRAGRTYQILHRELKRGSDMSVLRSFPNRGGIDLYSPGF